MGAVMIYQHVYKLWLFTLVEKYGNFKEAANHANITRSALSQNLTILEDFFNQSLFVRERGSVSLTPDGRRLLERVMPMLLMADDLESGLSPEAPLKGSLTLGSYESLAVRFLPSLLTTFRTLYPDFKIDIVTSRSDVLLKQVKSGALSMALVINGKKDNKIEVDHLGQDTLGLYMSSEKYRLLKNEESYAKLGIAILSTPEDGLPLYYRRFTKRIPSQYKASLTCDSFEAIRSLAISGTVIGLLPQKVAQREGPLLQKIWPLEKGIEDLSIHNISLVYRKNTDRRLIDIVKKVVST